MTIDAQLKKKRLSKLDPQAHISYLIGYNFTNIYPFVQQPKPHASRGPLYIHVLTLLHKHSREHKRALQYILLYYTLKIDSNSSSNSSSKPTSQPIKPNKHKSQALKDILHKFRPIKRVSYTPFQTKELQPIKALLPSTFPTQPHLYNYYKYL